ncbi:MAG: hypothetical protein A3F90_07775 [Deltaproteobacteria bacterium RIFCSPLOWO2_12_FULL_60_19]|nr:MAG: hypothetical protein A3F90_07775 [Deltaproteobacteria bacterium RIFCSPLOWO2_12_FULL_60_19]
MEGRNLAGRVHGLHGQPLSLGDRESAGAAFTESRNRPTPLARSGLDVLVLGDYLIEKAALA